MIIIGFILHYIIAVVVFGIFGIMFEWEVNPFFGGLIFLVIFYGYIYIRGFLRENEENLRNRHNKISSYNSPSEVIKSIIEREDFLLQPYSNIDYNLINYFQNTNTPIIKSEIGILKLYFVRDIFIKYLSTINSDKTKEFLAIVDTTFVDKYFELSQGDKSLEKIANRLEKYHKIIRDKGQHLGNDILSLLSETSSYNPLDWSVVYEYVLQNLKYVNIVVSELLKDKNLQNLFLNDEISNQETDNLIQELEDEYKKLLVEDIGNEIDDALELNEDKKENLLEDMYRQVYNGEYQKIIDFNNSFSGLFDYLKDTNNIEDMGLYCLLVGASYQEIGKTDIADKYYDVYLDNLTLSSHNIQVFQKEGIENVGVMKMLILVKRLQDLGLSYELPSKECEKLDNDSNNKKGEKK